MGRHQAPVPLGRRIIGAVLGAATIVVLMVLLWAISRNPAPVTAAAGFSLPTTTTGPTASMAFTSVTTSTTTTTTVTTTSATPTSSAPASSAPASTTSLPTTTSSQPPTTTKTLPEIELRPDGLGATDLGDSYDEARPVMELALGPPDSDTGWIGADSDFGVCPGTVLRVVRWDGLRLFFSDGPTEYAEEILHLYYYSQSGADTDQPLDLSTPQGIGLESTVEDLEEAYGDELAIQSTIDLGINFVVDPFGPGILSGTLTSSGPEGVISSLGGGYGCGA